jgi:hypothetical protein
MERGFILDNADGGARAISHWVPGAPRRSLWMRTKLPETPIIPVGVFRCSRCGYLDLYAREEFAAT